MKFTIVLPSHESTDLSLAALFIPCLIWHEGENKLLNPHPHEPLYQPGDLQQVLALSQLKERLDKSQTRAVVVCHSIGHGTETCLDRLVTDLRNSGYQPNVVRL